MVQSRKRKTAHPGIAKCQSGILGFDEITNGGLPRGRPTLVCGGPGCGKTLLGITFLVRGILDYDEPGVLVSFEETEEELTENVTSLGFDLQKLVTQQKLVIDYVQIDRSEIQESGDFNLEGLFVRLGHAIDSIGAKRVVLDTIESLFFGFSNEAILRAELRRLFRWLKEKGVTAVITAERGAATLTRHGLEEYVSDCVIFLDHRVDSLIATRRLRVVKYRGSSHGPDEYPFLITERGISVLPISSLGFDYDVSTGYVSSGIEGLDRILAGKGFYRGSSVLVSGTAGTGKTSLVAQAVAAACARGESCLYFAFEEASSQIVRNMRSIGIDLEGGIKSGLLHFSASRPSAYGLEMHLSTIHRLTEELKPRVVVVDPVTNLGSIAPIREIKSMLTRMIDYFKMNHITAFFTSLTEGGQHEELSDVGVSSLMDTWLVLRTIETDGMRDRILYVVKSRGMDHAMRTSPYQLTDHGVRVTADSGAGRRRGSKEEQKGGHGDGSS
jgi:circadian clock protein KaiC